MMKRKLHLSIVTFALPFTAAFGAAAHYTLGIPGAPEIRDVRSASANEWLSSNIAYSVMSVVTPGSNAVSTVTVAGMPKVKQSAAEAGFVMERTKPEYYICDRLCAQRFLRLRLIHLATRLDMQIIRYVRREGVHPAGVTAVGLLQRILGAVVPVYGYRCTCHLLWCSITVQRQRARQGELIQSGSTYRAFNDEQFGILCRDISLEFLNTARQRNAYHEAC